jgi:uncharacterized protein (UPF0147 family)
MAAMHRIMQSELHQKLTEEKREEWAQKLYQLEVKEEEERRASMLSEISQNPNVPAFVDAFTPQRHEEEEPRTSMSSEFSHDQNVPAFVDAFTPQRHED